MKPPTILCSLGFISTLGMSDFLLAQESLSKSLSNVPCYSSGVQEAPSKRAQGNRGFESISSPSAPELRSSFSRSESSTVKCGQVDRRMELLVFLLQIMRAPK
jgi:hypothetical protein